MLIRAAHNTLRNKVMQTQFDNISRLQGSLLHSRLQRVGKCRVRETRCDSRLGSSTRPVKRRQLAARTPLSLALAFAQPLYVLLFRNGGPHETTPDTIVYIQRLVSASPFVFLPGKHMIRSQHWHRYARNQAYSRPKGRRRPLCTSHARRTGVASTIDHGDFAPNGIDLNVSKIPLSGI
jgi:hypothetical protein